MPDLFIFFAGTAVTLMVSGAVGLLLWGASNEPAYGEPLEPEFQSRKAIRPLDRRPGRDALESATSAPRRERAGA